MASMAKYTAAPQHDPDAAYTQAPPDYVEGSGNRSRDEPLLGGSPRGSLDDDIPDDFKYGTCVAEATTDIRNQFVRKVYAILTVQLLVTAAVSSVSIISSSYKSWIQSHVALVWISLIASMGFMFLAWWKRKSYPVNLIFLSAFTLAEAYTVGVIVSLYDSRVVLMAVALTGAVFIFLTAFACQTKYDFSGWMPWLFGGLWGLVIFGFIGAFFPYNSTWELIYGGIAALVFCGYILVDTQLVMRKHHVEEEIAAAISLYLDVINLFLAILRILNSQNNN